LQHLNATASRRFDQQAAAIAAIYCVRALLAGQLNVWQDEASKSEWSSKVKGHGGLEWKP